MKVIPLDYVLILVFTVLCKTCKQQLIWAGNVVMLTQSNSALKPSVKGKGHFYLTAVVPSVPTRLLSMEADGELSPSTPPPATVSAPFYGYQSYSYTDQRKVEADVEVTEDRTWDLSLRRAGAR